MDYERLFHNPIIEEWSTILAPTKNSIDDVPAMTFYLRFVESLVETRSSPRDPVSVTLSRVCWTSSEGGEIALYGASQHPGTMLTMRPGEWVRIIGTGKITRPEDVMPLIRNGDEVNHANAQVSSSSNWPWSIHFTPAAALADLLLVNGDPIADIKVLEDANRNLVVVMKDGRIYKNILSK